MLDVARDMERICPDAWLIQSGNPVFEGCTLMTRETGVKIVGLCHGHYGYLDICRRARPRPGARDLAGAGPEPQHLADPLPLRRRGRLPEALREEQGMELVHKSVIERGKILEAFGTRFFEPLEEKYLGTGVQLFQQSA